MQNQWNNGMNQYPPYNNGDNGNDKGKKQFILGLMIGIFVTLLLSLLTTGVVGLGRGMKQLKDIRAHKESVTGGSVTDADVVQKLGILEETIQEYFWQDVDNATLEEGVYRGILASLDDPYSVYYTEEELLALQEQTQGIYY